MSSFPAQIFEGFARRDSVEPGLEIASRMELVHMKRNFKQSFLHGFICICPIGQN